jgi:hypothetical protein
MIEYTEENGNLPPTFYITKSNTDKLRCLWLNAVRKQEYEFLHKVLVLNHPMDIKRFFQHEGRLILDDALICSTNTLSLGFIIENIPKEDIAMVLRKENYALIDKLLMLENGKEKYKKTNKQTQDCFLEKLELLSKVDFVGMKYIIENRYDCSWMEDKVKSTIIEWLVKKYI